MDMWLFYDVTHHRHAYCNPVSEPGIRDLERILELRRGMRVLDIACGHAEMLVGFAERHGIEGVGVDLSPYACRRAREKIEARVPDARVRLVEGRGEEYVADGPFDVVLCIGASWIWKGYEGTLKALSEFARPGGIVVTGEPYWRDTPSAAWLEAEELTVDEFTTLDGYAQFAQGLGLAPLWMRGASRQEWDRYEMDQLASFDAFANEHADHPDLDAIRTKLLASKHAYWSWGREGFGFALWVFRTPPA